MKRVSLFALGALCLTSVIVQNAAADDIQWTITNLVFGYPTGATADGSVSGTFHYDSVTGAISEISLTSTAGTLACQFSQIGCGPVVAFTGGAYLSTNTPAASGLLPTGADELVFENGAGTADDNVYGTTSCFATSGSGCELFLQGVTAAELSTAGTFALTSITLPQNPSEPDLANPNGLPVFAGEALSLDAADEANLVRYAFAGASLTGVDLTTNGNGGPGSNRGGGTSMPDPGGVVSLIGGIALAVSYRNSRKNRWGH